MRITMLGCGPSAGVPVAGRGWGACDPDNPKNRRRRPSILVEEGDTAILVDTTPDLRDQAIDAGIQRLDAILYTHAHADHVHGIDDVRPLAWNSDGRIPAYMDAPTKKDVLQRFGYIFEKTPESPPHYRAPLEARNMAPGDRLRIGPLTIDIVEHSHGASGTCLGLIFNGRFAYSTDVAFYTDQELESLAGIEAWIVGCLRLQDTKSHANLDTVLGWIERVRPKQAYFTHMASELDYAETLAKCPPGVAPGHDGLVIEL